MTDTPTPDPHNRDLLDELLWLARDAHDRGCSDPARGNERLLVQRDTYARAAGLVASRTSHEDSVVIADRIIQDLTGGGSDLASIKRSALGSIPQPTAPQTLEWLGRKAFAARYGHLPGINHDYGIRWGDAGNQRISFRHGADGSQGMLYAYDPTWDEYAVIHRRVSSEAVKAAFVEALDRDENLPVEQFAHLLATHLARGSQERILDVLSVDR